MTEDWKNRIYQFEVAPPENAWQKITAALDESHLSDQFPTILHEMAVEPPATAWKKISAQLDPPVVKPAIFRRIPPYVRYAAAAVVFALIAFGTVQLLNSNRTATSDVLPVTKTEQPVITPEVKTESPQTEQEARDNLALEQSKQTLASLEISPANRKKISGYDAFKGPVEAEPEVFSFAPQNTYRELDTDVTAAGLQEEFPQSNSTANRYVMLITPDGNIIRMSKKLGDLVCCVSGEEQDEDCKDQLSKWRAKIVSTPSHSPGNFMELLSLLNSLQSK